MRGTRPLTADFLPPHQTGRADFPHPALAERLFRGFPPPIGGLFPGSNVALRHPHLSVVRCLRIEAEWRPSESIPFCQGPFAPRALPRFPATMGLSDSPAPNSRLMDSACVLPRSSRGRWQGSPSLPNLTFPARCPLSPRRAPPLFVNISSRRVSGFSFSGSLAVLTLCNEAQSGSLALRLTGSICGASAPELLPSLSASLHAGYSVGMMNTFQFTGLVGGAGAPEGTEVFIRNPVIGGPDNSGVYHEEHEGLEGKTFPCANGLRGFPSSEIPRSLEG